MATPLSRGVVEALVSRKSALSQTSTYLLWAGFNAVFAAFLFRDVLKDNKCSLVYHDILSHDVRNDVYHYGEVALVVCFALSLATNLYCLLWPRVYRAELKLDSKQKELLGLPGNGNVKEMEVQSTPKPFGSSPKPHLLTASPVRADSAASGSITPINTSASSWLSSPSQSPWSSFAHSEPGAVSFYLSSPSSPGSLSANSTQSEPIPLRHSPKEEFERRLKQEKETMLQRSFHELGDFVSSEAGLLNFYENNSPWSRQGLAHAVRNLSGSFREFSGGYDHLESTPPKRYVYQLASTSSSAPGATGRGKDEASSVTSMQTVALARTKLGISPGKLDVWTEHVRKWISETIVRPVHKEIEAVNDRLKSLGAGDNTRIGSMSLSQVAAIAVTGYQGVSASSADFSSLNTLIPFLDAHPNQEYLVRRIATLAKRGYLGEYRWNSGESFDGKPWGDHLPSDAWILLHLFASYFDIHLPMTSFESSRPFTHRHVLKKGTTATSPPGGDSKSSQSSSPSTGEPLKVMTSVGPIQIPEHMRDNPLICVAETYPPQFVFINKGEACEPAKGRNNLFHTLILFLHHVKTQNGGMLGRVNLGLSGINVLWILD